MQYVVFDTISFRLTMPCRKEEWPQACQFHVPDSLTLLQTIDSSAFEQHFAATIAEAIDCDGHAEVGHSTKLTDSMPRAVR